MGLLLLLLLLTFNGDGGCIRIVGIDGRNGGLTIISFDLWMRCLCFLAIFSGMRLGMGVGVGMRVRVRVRVRMGVRMRVGMMMLMINTTITFRF